MWGRQAAVKNVASSLLQQKLRRVINADPSSLSSVYLLAQHSVWRTLRCSIQYEVSILSYRRFDSFHRRLNSFHRPLDSSHRRFDSFISTFRFFLIDVFAPFLPYMRSSPPIPSIYPTTCHNARGCTHSLSLLALTPTLTLTLTSEP